jgi:hypothetical protein
MIPNPHLYGATGANLAPTEGPTTTHTAPTLTQRAAELALGAPLTTPFGALAEQKAITKEMEAARQRQEHEMAAMQKSMQGPDPH